MNAKYIIETGNEKLEFTNTALSLKKCLQIQRLSEANKKWKGYSLQKITFNPMGLISIHISTNKIRLCCCVKNTEPYFDTETEQWKCLCCKLPQHC